VAGMWKKRDASNIVVGHCEDLDLDGSIILKLI